MTSIYANGTEEAAKKIVEQLILGIEDDELDINDPSIDYTDDIGECEPINNILDNMTKIHSSSPIGTELRFPFEKYKPFDSDSINHTFQITSVFKDKKAYTSAIREIDGATDLFDLVSMTTNTYTLLSESGKNTVKEAIEEVKTRAKALTGKNIISEKEYQSVINKLDDITNQISISPLTGLEGMAEFESGHLNNNHNAAVTAASVKWRKKYSSNSDVARVTERLANNPGFIRKDSSKIKYITIHGTGGPPGSIKDIIDAWGKEKQQILRARGITWFNYMISRDGTIHSFVDPGKFYVLHDQTGHGQASRSIGIELAQSKNACKKGSYGNMDGYTRKQMVSLLNLTTYLITKYPGLQKGEIRGHRWIALREGKHSKPSYSKCCPGPLFDWRLLASSIVAGKDKWEYDTNDYEQLVSRSELLALKKKLSNSEARRKQYIEETKEGLDIYPDLPMKPERFRLICEVNETEKNSLRVVDEHLNSNTIPITEEGELETSTNQLGGGLNQVLQQAIQRILARANAAIYRTLINDVSSKVENISINATPGMSKYIPIEGEKAPVAQSTGGRSVHVTIRLTEVDILNLARLSLMFRSSKKDNTLLSMLMMARSVYKTGQGRRRLKYLYDFATTQFLKKRLKSLSTGSNHVRLDEPVRIKNDILSSLGLTTFIPTNMEIQSDPQRAEAYNVMLTFQYINLGYRGIESLKKSKSGSQIPLLPICARLSSGSPSSDDNQADTTQSQLKFLGSTARAAMRFGLTDFVPVYVAYKLACMKDTLWKLSEGGNKTVDMLDIRTIMKLTVPASMGNELDKHARELRTWDAGFAKKLKSMAYPATGIAAMLSFMSKGMAKGKGKLRVLGTILQLVGKGAGIAGLGTAGAAGFFNTMVTEEQKEWNWLSFNIPSLVPMMMYEMLQEFLTHHRAGREEEWMKEVADIADRFLSVGLSDKISMGDGEKADENDVDTPRSNSMARTVRFPSPIKVESLIIKDGKPTDTTTINKMHGMAITMFTAGEHAKHKIQIFGQDLGTYATGLSKKEADLESLTKAYTKDVEEMKGTGNEWLKKAERGMSNDIGDRHKYMCVLAAGLINLTTVRVLKEIDGYYGSFFSSNVDPLEAMEITAHKLSTNATSRDHAINLIKSIITSTSLDILSSSLIVGTNDGNTVSKLQENIDKKTNNEPIETRDMARAVNDYNKMMINSIKSAIISAVDLNANSIELLNGMFVDNAYSSSTIRKGYCDAMIMLLGIVETIGYGALKGDRLDSLLRPGTPSRDLYNDMISVHDIMKTLAPTKLSTIFETVSVLIMTFAAPIIEMIAAGLIIKLIGIGLTVLFGSAAILIIGIITAIVFIFIAIDTFLDDMLKGGNAIRRVFTGSRFVLSEWFAARLREGTNIETLVEICMKTRIWSSYLLDFNNDANDNRETSYIDFPILVVSGKPMAPDFYIYKAGATYDAMKATMQQINDLLDIAKDRYQRIDNLDFDGMLKDLQTRLRDVADYVIEDAANMLTGSLEQWIKNSSISWGTRYTNTGAKERERIKEGITFMSSAISQMLFGDEDDEFANFIINDRGTTTKPTFEKRKCVFTITISIEEISVIISTPEDPLLLSNFRDKKRFKYEDSHSKRREQLQEIATKLESKGLSLSHVMKVGGILLGLAEKLSEYGINVLTELSDAVPDSLAQLSLIRSLVGSSLRAIGTAGMSSFRRQLRDVGFTSVRKAATFASGYIFPTVKLFFIEEDNDNFYMFDDLYSYASIIDLSVHMDRMSPVQTCIIRVTNIHGHLNNIMSDKKNIEANFVRAPDENGPINSVLLRPGCKIKVQCGNTPLLNEDNTVFTGRISTINFGDVTTIEAQSHGDVLMEEITPGQVVVYGKESDISTSLWSDIKSSFFGTLADLFLGVSYKTGISSIKDVIGYILGSLITTSSHLDDFSISSGIEVEMDKELQIHANTLRQAMYLKYIPERAEQVAKSIGIDADIGPNNQLFENIHIGMGGKSDDRWFKFLIDTDGAWVSKDESAWEALSELNLLLPQTVMSIRPFDTRGTFVWTDTEGYYRYRRSADLSTIGATMCASKLINALSNPSPKFLSLAQMFKNYIKSEGEYSEAGKAAMLAMITLIAYYAAPINKTMTAESKRDNIDSIVIDPTSTDGLFVRNAVVWFLGKGNTSTDFSVKEVSDRIKLVGSSIEQMHTYTTKTVDKNKKPNTTTITEIATEIAIEGITNPVRHLKHAFTKGGLQAYGYRGKAGNPIKQIERGIRMAFAVDASASEILNYMVDASLDESSCHKRSSDYHIKTSGRDIIRNDIELNQPFNTVRMMFPPAQTDVGAAFLTALDPSEESHVEVVPVHHSLKPWDWKVYASFFKNANSFPTARGSVISMAISSTLANLMKETYGGQITILGDPTIRDHDRVLLWDENRDLFGLIGVRTHTFTFSSTEGCISTIVPDMLTKTEYIMSDSSMDSTLWAMNTLLHIANLAAGLFFATRGIKQTRRIFKIQSHNEALQGRAYKLFGGMKRRVSNFTKGVRGRAGNVLGGRLKGIRSGIKGFRDRHTREPSDLLFKSKDSKISSIRKGLVDIHMDAKKKIETKVTSIVDADQVKSMAASKKVLDKNIEDIPLDKFKGLWNEAWRKYDKGEGDFVGLLAKEKVSWYNRNKGYSFTDRDTITLKGELSRTFKKKVGARDPIMKDVEKKTNALLDKSKLTSNEKIRIQKGVDILHNHIFKGSWDLLPILNNASKYLGVSMVADWGISSVRQISDMWLINTETQDNVVITPLFFRGEPFVAGLEDVVKVEGERMGLFSIMKARLGNVFTAASRAISDPMNESLAQYIRENARQTRTGETKGVNPIDMINRKGPFEIE